MIKEILKGSDTAKFSYYQLEIVEGLIASAIKKAKQEKDKEIAVISSEWNDNLNEAVKKAKQELVNDIETILIVRDKNTYFIFGKAFNNLKEKHNLK